MNLKKTKIYIFFIFWARRGLIPAPMYLHLHVNGESGLHSSLWEIIWRNIWKM